ncbi:SusC/RagA family TonB-linked outer membrane protein [Pedobacter hiemivivus]|nr:SusC/RagA family TonB-linked outer membrane protein [Pedobacter hiemivivus]
MKLTTFILLLSLMQVSASTFAQRFTLKGKNISYAKLFFEIRKQTGFNVLVESSEFKTNKRIDVNFINSDLDNVMKQLVSGKELTYIIEDKSVVIRRTTDFQASKFTDFFRQGTLKGQVTDSLGQAVSGANVNLVGKTSYVTITNDFGNFEFANMPAGDYKLTVTYVGYRTETRDISVQNSNINMNIRMSGTSTILTTVNVVNTGYQQIAAERVTGAFDNINNEQLGRPSVNIASRLIGTTAGMQVSLDVNGRPNIKVRGQSTLFAGSFNGGTSNQPLVVVDGFPVRGALDQYSTLNPNDVESISILKDAAASSVWGAKAANGVIVITTKKGVNNSPLKIEFSAFTSLARKVSVDYLTGFASSSATVAYEQLAFQKWGARIMTNSYSGNYFRQSEATVNLNENFLGFLSNAQLTNNLNQLSSQDNRSQISDYLLANPTTHQYNVALSGGGKNINNLVSILAEQVQSNFKGSSNYRYAVNYRASANIFKWLDFNLSSTFQLQKATNNGASAFDIQGISPYELLKNPDGSLTDIHQYYQPILDRFVPVSRFPYSFSYNPIQDINGRNVVQSDIIGRLQAGLTIKILKGLSYSPQIQYENFSIQLKNYQSDQTFRVRQRINESAFWNLQPTGNVTLSYPLGGTFDQNRSTTEAYNFRNQINFSRTIGNDHEINAVAGTEVSRSVGESFTNPTTFGYNEKTLTVGTFPFGPGIARPAVSTNIQGFNSFQYTNSFGYSVQKYYSVFANAAYTYKGKYTLSGSYRTDASNLIAADPKYRSSPFYSMGLRYNITGENYMKNIYWLDRLTLRATYGRTGNVDNSTSPFTLLSLAGTPNQYTNATTATVANQGNPTLTWEKTATLNLGFDYAVLNNKLYGKVDVYEKRGTDLIAQIPVSSVVGATNQRFNNAAMTNRGIEITLGTSLPIKGTDISWNGNFNAAYNSNKITRLFNTNYQAFSLVNGGSASYVEGYSASTVWAYQYLGLVLPGSVPGGPNSPAVQGPSGPIALNSFPNGDARGFLKQLGPQDAPYNFGMTNSFKVYDFNLSFIITARAGGIFRSQFFNYPRAGTTTPPNSQLSKVLNGDPNQILTLPSNPNDATFGSWITFYPYLSYNYVTSSLIRLQEFNLSYNIPTKLLNKINVRGAQLLFQGNNVYTWLANDTGIDPDYPTGSINGFGTVRPRAQYTFGIKFQL